MLPLVYIVWVLVYDTPQISFTSPVHVHPPSNYTPPLRTSQVVPSSTQSLLRLLRGTVPGITTPQLALGMLFSSTPWHTKDHYLYSFDYHHTGAPKVWYAVPAADAAAFEGAAGEAAYGPAIARVREGGGDGSTVQQRVAAVLLDKSTMFAPHALLDAGMGACNWVCLGGGMDA